MALGRKFSAFVEKRFEAFRVYVKKKVTAGDYELARFPFWWCIVITMCRGELVDTRSLQRLHWNLNTWKDEEVQQWKNSHLASCNSIAVAGAIFATLGLTALQIPDMDEAFWTARACCVASMVLGVLSVITATRQHLDVVMLESPLSVTADLPQWTGSRTASKYAKVPVIRDLPLESSVVSFKAVTMPRHLLDLSVISFMLGIGLYELSGWHFFMTYKSYQDGSSNEEAEDESLDIAAPPPLENTDYRNVFIVFIITLGLCLAYWFKILDYVNRESAKKNREFGTSSFGRTEASALRYLRLQLREVHDKFRSEPQVDPESDKPDVVTVLVELSHDLKARDDQWRQIFAHTLRQPPDQLCRTMSI